MQEDAQNRGGRFAYLAQSLVEAARKEGRPLDEFTVFLLLGPPDYWTSTDVGTGYAYLIDRFGKKDWTLFVIMDSQRFVTNIGYNATRANDLSGWKKYVAPPNSCPSTQPRTMKAN